MSNPHSIVHYGIDAEQKSIDQAIAKQQWVGAANNTKWSELITFMQNDDKSPSYRYCWMPNHFISNWDVEWFGHIPRPFAGVLWLDIGTLEKWLKNHGDIRKLSTILIDLKNYWSKLAWNLNNVRTLFGFGVIYLKMKRIFHPKPTLSHIKFFRIHGNDTYCFI
nr:DUF6678 family protein [Acinetobacter baumannii]